jgi:hypothetical protein
MECRLWTIFKPGSLIYSMMYGQHRAFVLKSTRYIVDPNEPDFFSISTWYTDSDGTKLGARVKYFKIPTFDQEIQIEELEVFPLKYHPSVGEVRQSLFDRGQSFQTLCGTHNREYEAIAIQERLSTHPSFPNEFVKIHVS